MEEGLLFDGIALDPGNISAGNIEGAAMVEANFADAGLTFGNRTTMAARVAADSIVIELSAER